MSGAGAERGALYVVATPIGNLGDLTPRAAEALAAADFIAAEDTRVTVKLLNHLGLKKRTVSYHEHNAAERGGEILARVAAGEACALCSDAGTPAVSDPGQALVAQALDMGIRVIPVPAACALAAALSVCGQPAGRFVFEGFLPVNRRARAERLEELKGEERALVFYEAPHKLCRTLGDMCAAFGEGRPLTLCRELTKLHEQVCKTTLGEARGLYAGQAPRGEFVLVLAGAPPAAAAPRISLREAALLAGQLSETRGLSAGAAARQAAAETGHSRNEVYAAAQALREVSVTATGD